MRCPGCGVNACRVDVTLMRCEWCTKPPRSFQERCDDYAAAMDERGAHEHEIDQHNREAS